jgi:hypothetical protein
LLGGSSSRCNEAKSGCHFFSGVIPNASEESVFLLFKRKATADSSLAFGMTPELE